MKARWRISMVLGCSLAGTPVLAAPMPPVSSSYVGISEEVWNYSTGAITDESWSQSGEGISQIHFPQQAGQNSGGYADPAQQIIRAYGIAHSVDPTGTAQLPPGPPPSHLTDRSCSDVSASFSTIAYVGAGTSGLPAGTPVRLAANLRLDGALRTGPIYPNPGTVSCWAEMWASYRVTDPTLRVDTGEGWSCPPLLNFGLDASMITETLASNTSPYNLAGYVSKDYETSWSLFTNTGDDLADNPWFYEESAYPSTPVAITEPWPDSVWSIDTGSLRVYIDTYIGAELHIDSNMDLLLQCRYDAPLVGGDFSNTFGVSFQPDTGYENIQVSVGIPVPEPTLVLGLLGLGGIVLGRRRAQACAA